LICQTFHFAYKIQQRFTIWNGVETLDITRIFDGVSRTFSYTQAWASEWGRNLKISAKKAVFLVLSGKKQISPLLANIEKHLKKSTSAPPWKKSFRSPCAQACKMTPFLQKFVLYYIICQHYSTTPFR